MPPERPWDPRRRQASLARPRAGAGRPVEGVRPLSLGDFTEHFGALTAWESGALWLCGLEGGAERFAPEVVRGLSFAGLDDAEGRLRAMLALRAGGEAWCVGEPRWAAALVDAVRPATVWLDAPVWESEAFAERHPEMDVIERCWHLRATPEGAARPVPAGIRAVGADELAPLRLLDMQQYGCVLPGIDYKAMAAAGVVWAARRDQRLVASATLSFPGEFVSVSAVWTHTAHRRSGHARRLMEGILAGVVAPRGATCVLNVEDTNVAAMRLYQEVGFRPHHQVVHVGLPGSAARGTR